MARVFRCHVAILAIHFIALDVYFVAERNGLHGSVSVIGRRWKVRDTRPQNCDYDREANRQTEDTLRSRAPV